MRRPTFVRLELKKLCVGAKSSEIFTTAAHSLARLEDLQRTYRHGRVAGRERVLSTDAPRGRIGELRTFAAPSDARVDRVDSNANGSPLVFGRETVSPHASVASP